MDAFIDLISLCCSLNSYSQWGRTKPVLSTLPSSSHCQLGLRVDPVIGAEGKNEELVNQELVHSWIATEVKARLHNAEAAFAQVETFG